MDLLQIVLSLSLGLGLAAACGFRVFIPPLMMGVASRFGLYELDGSFSWVGETWAIGIFGIATLIEVGGYYIPWIDNLLDTIATPAAIIGGIFVTSASLEGDMDSGMQWMLAIIAGGSTAGVIQIGTVATRAASTGTTGGLGNPVISTLEAIASIVCVLLAILATFIIGIIVILLIWKAISYILKNKEETKVV